MNPFSVVDAVMGPLLSLVGFVRKQIQNAQASEEEKKARLMRLNADLLADVPEVKTQAQLNRDTLAGMPDPAPTAK